MAGGAQLPVHDVALKEDHRAAIGQEPRSLALHFIHGAHGRQLHVQRGSRPAQILSAQMTGYASVELQGQQGLRAGHAVHNQAVAGLRVHHGHRSSVIECAGQVDAGATHAQQALQLAHLGADVTASQ
ncbi:hypothetical protein D3C72_1771290 [compost metagenome]